MTAAKVFIIIGMVLGFPLIFPVVLGAICLSVINQETDPSKIRTWGIITIFFVSIIGGILMLTTPSEKGIRKTKAEENYEPSAYKKLQTIKKLHDAGAITDSEFEEKRKKYVEEL